MLVSQEAGDYHMNKDKNATRGPKLWKLFSSEEGRSRVAEQMKKPFRKLSEEGGKLRAFKGSKKIYLKQISSDMTVRLHMGDRVSASGKGDLIPGEDIPFISTRNEVVKPLYDMLKKWDKEDVHIHILMKRSDSAKLSEENKYTFAVFISTRPLAVKESDAVEPFPFTYPKSVYDSLVEDIYGEDFAGTSTNTSPYGHWGFSYTNPTNVSSANPPPTKNKP